MKRFATAAVLVVVVLVVMAASVQATLAPWPVQPEYYGVLAHWRFNDNQVAGAVAQYKLDDEAASTVVDNNLGTDGTWGHDNTDAHDAAAWCANFGQSLEFDGSYDYINTGQTFQTTFRDSFSISLWVQPHDGQPDTCQALFGVSDFDGYVTSTLATLLTDGTISVTYSPSDGNSVTALTADPVFADGEQNWHNLVIVFDSSSSIVIYVDGVARPLSAENNGDLTGLDFTQYTNPHNLYLGVRNTDLYRSFYFDGRMDNVAIYARALTAQDVAWLASCGTQDTESNILTVEGGDAAGKDLTSVNSISNVATESGQIGRCFTFDGANDYLYRADDSDFDFGTDADFSVSFWMKQASTQAEKRIIRKRQPGSWAPGWQIGTAASGGVVDFFRADGTNYRYTSTSVSVQDDAWHHVVVVREAGSTAKIYVDGVDQTATPQYTESYNLDNTSEIHVACDEGHDKWFNGSLDDMIIFDRALTATEVDAIYDRGTLRLEVGSPVTDWEFWESTRLALWQYRWSRGSHPDTVTFPALAEYQSGGDYAAEDWPIGELYVGYEGEIYVNKVAKTASPLAANLEPDTDPNWYLAASPVDYSNWDKLQDRWAYDGTQWQHGHDWLPTQLNPYCQSLGTRYLGVVQLPEPQIVTLTDAIIQEYADAIEDLLEWIRGRGGEESEVTEYFKDWWEEIAGDAYNVALDGHNQPVESEFWNCNGSSAQLQLAYTGGHAYIWKLVTSHTDDSNSPDYLAFHPKWWDKERAEWHPWVESDPNMGYIQAVWKRVPRFKEGSYNHAADEQPRLWMGDASQEPPGLNGKTFRDRYIRCAVDLNGDPLPTTPVSGTNSMLLSEVESAYDAQYGYWDDSSWVNGSVTYNGSQMYAAVEASQDGEFTEIEVSLLAASVGGKADVKDGWVLCAAVTRPYNWRIPEKPVIYPKIEKIRTYSLDVSPSDIGSRTMSSGEDMVCTGGIGYSWEELVGTFTQYMWDHGREVNPNVVYLGGSPVPPNWSVLLGDATSLHALTAYELWGTEEAKYVNSYCSGTALQATAISGYFPSSRTVTNYHGVKEFFTNVSYELEYIERPRMDCYGFPYIYQYSSFGVQTTFVEDLSEQEQNTGYTFKMFVDCPHLRFHSQWRDPANPELPIYENGFPWTVYAPGKYWYPLPSPPETNTPYIAQNSAEYTGRMECKYIIGQGRTANYSDGNTGFASTDGSGPIYVPAVSPAYPVEDY